MYQTNSEGQIILLVILAIVTAEFVLERVLSFLNRKNMSNPLPEKLTGIYEEDKYRKSQEYSAVKSKFGLFSSTVTFLFTIAMLAFGGYGWLDGLVSEWTQNTMLQAIFFFGVLALISDIIGIPFELYNTFVIEEKFGFNKMKPATFIADKVKGWVIGAIVGGGLLSAFIWFYQSYPSMFWLYGWGIIMAVMLLITMFYTNLLLPLFNKITPLEEGELRAAIEAYAATVNFPLKKIMVMDGSKRSTKANAFFSGLGSNKNIVLYDTLIEKLDTDEIVAVLAHEVGHYKKKHTLQSIVITAINMFVTLYVLSLVIDLEALSVALGAGEAKFHLGLLAFSLLYSPLSLVTGLLMNLFSRKNEYEADAYATKTSSGLALIGALKKLTVDSLSNLTPHPAFVFFHYSHPPLLQRMNAMEKEMETI
ncbi:M48 family metallopeptidase [Limibacter armeniacum]|uniref:M48 family metallopeptidase n=1 Tax=Limibacter armeniacum TaxID=466084 RepID=UPI002FE6353A